MVRGPLRWYALFCGVFLLAQGTTTLAARLWPSFDGAFPQLLATTQMVPSHSALHIATAGLAFALLRAGARAAWWFALGFGSFYALLGVAGWASGRTLGLGLQSFDHPFHVLLGGLGLAAAAAGRAARGS